MSNTGTKIVLTLKQIATGATKPDTVGDPNYIAPYTDLTACPITFGTSCPLIAATGVTGSVQFEFSLPNSVVNNPAIDTVKFVASSSVAATVKSQSFSLPVAEINYFGGVVTGLPVGFYNVLIQYLLGASLVTTCTYTASFSVH